MMLRIAFLVVAAMLTAAPSHADLVWNYSSSNGATVVEGLLTTAGTAGDELTPGTVLSLVSIDTVVLNGDLLDAPSDWGTIGPFGSIPPFATSVSGSIAVDTPGVALLSTPALFAAGTLNSVVLADPLAGGDTEVRFDGGLSTIADFAPTSTFLTFVSVAAVPEPTTTLAFSLLGVGLIASRRITSED